MAKSRVTSQNTPSLSPEVGHDTASPASSDPTYAMQGSFGNSFVQDVVQRKSSGGTGTGTDTGSGAAFSAATSGGGGEVSYREEMEEAFGEDFGDVEAYTGQGAELSAIDASAAASGEKVAFSANNPDKETVAHELTHVVQDRQSGGAGVQGFGGLSSPSSSAEVEASSVGRAVASGESAPAITAAPTAAVSRDEEGQFPPGWDPDAEARKLYSAFDGWGTDEGSVLDVLYTGRQDMSRAIERAYNSRYDESLSSRLHEELSGSALRRAIRLLGHGELSLRDRVREAVEGWGTNEDAIFNGLERAGQSEIDELAADARLVEHLRGDLNSDDWALVQAYFRGQGRLAATLRRAVAGWGTDEATIWRAIEGASQAERDFVLSQPALMDDLVGDLDDADALKARRMLRGNLTNVDRIEIAMAGWGTDEGGLTAAFEGLTAEEFAQLPSNIDARMVDELSSADLSRCQEILHQKRLLYDAAYAGEWMSQQAAALGEGALEDQGSTVLMAAEGQTQSAVGRLITACAGGGTEESDIFQVASGLNEDEKRFIRDRNPSNVLGVLREDLSEADYTRVMSILGGGAAGTLAAMREAVEGWGTDETLLYQNLDRLISQGGAEALQSDPTLMAAITGDLSDGQSQVVRDALRAGAFSPMLRLKWATDRAGTDEDLIWTLCQQYGEQWRTSEGAIIPAVDTILDSELSTRDYWRALDTIRGEPRSEQERLDRAKELLERERGGVSEGIMDTFSDSGENADDAWREYQATFNQAHSDGEISEEETSQLREDEAFSQRMTSEYRDAKASVAQWATTIAVAIVGIAATILTAGAAGPFVAGIAAQLGGTAAIAAEAMVAAAVLKVGLNRAIQGEGYDVTSSEALVDAVSASVEVGLTMVGGQVATRFMSGLGNSAIARSVGPSVQRVFGRAGTRILGAGLEGGIDGTLGGIGEGLVQGLAMDSTWEGDVETIFGNLGTSVGTATAFSAGGGMFAGAAFRSIGETFGPLLSRNAGAVDGVGDDVAGAGDGNMLDELGIQDAANGNANGGLILKQPGGGAVDNALSPELQAAQLRMQELQGQGAFQDSGYHGSNSAMLDGLEKTDGRIIPAAELDAANVTQVTGEGDAFSGRAGKKTFISIGEGESGFGTSLAYADATSGLNHYNVRRYTLAELEREISELRDVVDNFDTMDIDIQGPMAPLYRKQKGQFSSQLEKLQDELVLRMDLPATHPRRVGGQSNLEDYPVLFEFDLDNANVRSRPGMEEGGTFGGEAELHGSVDLKTQLKRVYCPEDQVASVQARLQGILGHSDFEVIPMEATNALPADGFTSGSRAASYGWMSELQDYYLQSQGAHASAARTSQRVDITYIMQHLHGQ